MNKIKPSANPAIFVLAVAATLLLAFNMVAILVFQEEIFLDHTLGTGVEVIMLMGFAVLFLFEVATLIWAAIRRGKQNDILPGIAAILPLSVVAILALMVSKVIIDEIGHEYGTGTLGGEGIILYLVLTLQLLFGLFVARLAWFIIQEPVKLTGVSSPG
ncbi:hypothetical protein ACFLZR_00195 [Candidatus Neomarinimicrobiota bacterium]